MAAIIVLVLLAIMVWGLVILLSNPVVQALLALVAIVAVVAMLRRDSED